MAYKEIVMTEKVKHEEALAYLSCYAFRLQIGSKRDAYTNYRFTLTVDVIQIIKSLQSNLSLYSFIELFLVFDV